MASLGTLTLDLVAKTGGFTGPIEKTRRQARRQMRDIQRSAKTAAAGIAAVTAAAAAAASGLYLFTKAGMDAVDADAKLARQLDSTIGGLRGLQRASEDAGVSTGVINSAMERFSARLGEAQRGTGQAKDALDRLGLSAASLAGMDVDERVAAIADRVQALGLSGAETADVLRQFGIRNREIVNLLRQGGGAIRGATQEVEDYGLAISQVDAAAIEAANDALSRVALVFDSIQQTLAVELAPMILVVTERFNDAAREAGGFGSAVSQAVETSLIGLGELLDTYQEWRILNQRVVVATKDMELAFARFAASAWTSVSGFLDKWARGMNNIIAGLRGLPGMGDLQDIGLFSESDFLANIEERMGRALGARNIAALDLGDLIDEGSYREKLEQFLADVEARRAELSEIAGDGGLPGGGGLPDPGGGSGGVDGATRAINDQARAYQTLLDTLYPLKASQREFAESQALLNANLEEGTDAHADAMKRLEDQYRSTRDVAEAYAIDATKGVNRIADAADDLGMTFSSAFEDAVIGGNNLRDVMKGLAEDIARIAVREAATKPLAGAISSMIGSALGGSAVPGGFTSQIDTGAAFVGQAHSGIHTVPKSGTWNLEKGERVVTAETSVKLDRTLDRVQRDSGGNTVVQVIDQRSGGERAQVQETQGADGMRRIRVLIRDEVKAMHADGSMDSTMARNYGNRRRPL